MSVLALFDANDGHTFASTVVIHLSVARAAALLDAHFEAW